MCVYMCSAFVFVRACVHLRVYASHAMNIHNNKNDTNPIRMSGMRPKMCVSMLTLIHSHEYQRPVEPTTNVFKNSPSPPHRHTQHQQQDKVKLNRIKTKRVSERANGIRGENIYTSAVNKTVTIMLS